MHSRGKPLDALMFQGDRDLCLTLVFSLVYPRNASIGSNDYETSPKRMIAPFVAQGRVGLILLCRHSFFSL
jgi:hypothetical protein